MADRVGVINKGELILVEDKDELMHKLGRKQLTLHLGAPLEAVPDSAVQHRPRADGADDAVLAYDADKEQPPIASILRRLEEAGIAYKDLETRQSSLEEIFVSLVRGPKR